MKTRALWLPLLLSLALPLVAEEGGKKEGPKMDEATKAELDAAKKKFEAAKVELEKVTEKIKAARPEGEKNRPDMATLAGMVEMFKQQLSLTEPQVKKAGDLAAAGQKDLDKAMEVGKAQGSLADEERAKDTIDLAKLRKILMLRNEAMVDGDLVRTKFIQDIKGLLTPAQLEKYMELKKRMDERAKQRAMGGPGGGPGGGEGGRPPRGPKPE